MPAETIVLIASSTLTFNFFNSLVGTISKNPEVGLGVVGIKTLVNFFFNLFFTSPSTSPVVNPITHKPFLGYSTRTASLKASELVFNIVSKICLIVL